MSSMILPYRPMLSYVALFIVATSGFMFLEYIKATDGQGSSDVKPASELFGNSEVRAPALITDPISNERSETAMTADDLEDDAVSSGTRSDERRPRTVKQDGTGQRPIRQMTDGASSTISTPTSVPETGLAPATVDVTRLPAISSSSGGTPTTASSNGNRATSAASSVTTPSATNDDDQRSGADPADVGVNPNSQYIDVPPWEQIIESKGCLAQLPPGSTQADAESARLATGCNYAQQCTVRNDRTDAVDCYWYFRN